MRTTDDTPRTRARNQPVDTNRLPSGVARRQNRLTAIVAEALTSVTRRSVPDEDARLVGEAPKLVEAACAYLRDAVDRQLEQVGEVMIAKRVLADAEPQQKLTPCWQLS